MPIEVAESTDQNPNDEYSFENLERLLMSDDETETEEAPSAPPEAAPEVPPEAAAPVQAQAPVQSEEDPRKVSLVALQAERQEKAKLRNSYNQLLSEFEEFKRQTQFQAPPAASPPPASNGVPDREEDLLGWVDYEFKRRDAERDAQIEAIKQEALRVAQDATSVANQAKFEVIQAETRRQIGETEFDAAINAFNAYEAENPGRINMYEVFSTANPAYTAYELGKTILDAQRAAAPQPQMNLEELKAQIRNEVINELTPSLKQAALKEAATEIAAKLKGIPAQTTPQGRSIVSIPSATQGVEKAYTAVDVPKEVLQNSSRDNVRKYIEQLWELDQAEMVS